MHARLLAVGNRLFATKANGIFLRLNFQIAFLHAGQFDDCNEVVALLKYVDRWKTADRSGAMG